jgi:hypothetical protein
MNPTGSIDQREFDAALKQYLAVTPHDLEFIINKKALFVARGAFERTPKALRSTIEAGLGITGYNLNIGKRGKILKRARGAAILGDSLVYRIINAKRRRAGQRGLTGPAMAAAAKKFIGRRMSAIGSLKAGWVGPIKAFAARVKDVIVLERTPRVKQRGRAKVAEPGWNPQAEIEYGLTSRWPGDAYIDPRTIAALQASFNHEAASMLDYVATKLGERAKTISVK